MVHRHVELLYVERSPVTQEANAVVLVFFFRICLPVSLQCFGKGCRVDIFTVMLIYGMLQYYSTE
jgi:hypothetical protein